MFKKFKRLFFLILYWCRWDSKNASVFSKMFLWFIENQPVLLYIIIWNDILFNIKSSWRKLLFGIKEFYFGGIWIYVYWALLVSTNISMGGDTAQLVAFHWLPGSFYSMFLTFYCGGILIVYVDKGYVNKRELGDFFAPYISAGKEAVKKCNETWKNKITYDSLSKLTLDELMIFCFGLKFFEWLLYWLHESTAEFSKPWQIAKSLICIWFVWYLFFCERPDGDFYAQPYTVARMSHEIDVIVHRFFKPILKPLYKANTPILKLLYVFYQFSIWTILFYIKFFTVLYIHYFTFLVLVRFCLLCVRICTKLLNIFK